MHEPAVPRPGPRSAHTQHRRILEQRELDAAAAAAAVALRGGFTYAKNPHDPVPDPSPIYFFLQLTAALLGLGVRASFGALLSVCLAVCAGFLSGC